MNAGILPPLENIATKFIAAPVKNTQRPAIDVLNNVIKLSIIPSYVLVCMTRVRVGRMVLHGGHAQADRENL